MNITDGNRNAIWTGSAPAVEAPTSSAIYATLDSIVESELHSIQKAMESVIMRTKSLHKYLPSEARNVSTELITELFEFSDKEAVANLLLGNK